MSVASRGRTARSIPPGRMMAIAGEAGEVNLWYLADGTIAWRLPPRDLRGPIDRLTASGNGRRFATLEYDETRTVVRIWEIRQRAMLAQIDVDAYAVSDIALDEEGATLYIAHETRGLLKAKVSKNAAAAQPKPTGSSVAGECRGQIQWISALNALFCAVPQGVVQLDRDGHEKRRHLTPVEASNWLASAALGGKRLVAVGDGHMLIWEVE